MKQLFIVFINLVLSLQISAQKDKYLSAAVVNTQPAYPFGKFKGLFTDALHPGIEFSYGNNFKHKQKHDWFYEFNLGYFYHRYVQHGVPLTANLGYRYHFNSSFSLQTNIGAGLMKAIPAAQVFNLNTDGMYTREKQKGREQIIATYVIGGSYQIARKAGSRWKLFINYQQRIQFPFIKSYVPILPYNSIMFGISKSLAKNESKEDRKSKKFMNPVEKLFIQKSSAKQ